jgi:hypothetical protein
MSEADANATNGKTILYIEDDLVVLTAYRDRLQKAGGVVPPNECPNRSTFVSRPFQTTSNFPNWLMMPRRSVASANILWLLGYFLKITFFPTMFGITETWH